jgi:dihydroorotase-like cyclic amidohydrolase
MPTIQESFSAMLTLAARTDLPLTRIAALMSENAGRIFGLQNKGKLAPGYDADLVIIDPKAEWTVGKPAYKCGWTPYEGMTFTGRILQVWLRGEKVVENGETLSASPSGQPLAYKPIG